MCHPPDGDGYQHLPLQASPPPLLQLTRLPTRLARPQPHPLRHQHVRLLLRLLLRRQMHQPTSAVLTVRTRRRQHQQLRPLQHRRHRNRHTLPMMWASTVGFQTPVHALQANTPSVSVRRDEPLLATALIIQFGAERLWASWNVQPTAHNGSTSTI